MILETIGWLGSIVIIASLVINVKRHAKLFRWLNLIGCITAIIYNVAYSIWPFALVNTIIAIINVVWLYRLYFVDVTVQKSRVE